MNYNAVLPYNAYKTIVGHLLQHVQTFQRQEDLCFGLWHPSRGTTQYSAIVSEFIDPIEHERTLHGNAAFHPDYLSRSLHLALRRGMGLAFMHSHLAPGWQDMSHQDVVAERDRIAPASAATGLPLVGLTMGTDGSLSARFWTERSQRGPKWCQRVRVVGPDTMNVTYNDSMFPPYQRRPQLQRTIDSWGLTAQGQLARLNIGIVGIGSVGAMVAEALARMGIANLTLIDADKVAMHNLDRLLNASVDDVGTHKVHLAANSAKRAATAEDFQVIPIADKLQSDLGYHAALDCDLLFSCVDRPLAKDLLNHIAYAHCIPVVFGGIFVDTKTDGRLAQANWSVSVVGPGRRCLRCDGQYSSSDVVQELDGTLENPEYLRHDTANTPRNQNVFPFSANLASLQVLEMIRYLIAEDWWPAKSTKTTYYFLRGQQERHDSALCNPNCSISRRLALADTSEYPFIEPALEDHVVLTTASDKNITDVDGFVINVWRKLKSLFK